MTLGWPMVFTILEHHILKETDEVLVLGQLKIGRDRQDPVWGQAESPAPKKQEIRFPWRMITRQRRQILSRNAQLCWVWALHLYTSDKSSAPKSIPPKKIPPPLNPKMERWKRRQRNNRLSSAQFKYILRLIGRSGRPPVQDSTACPSKCSVSLPSISPNPTHPPDSEPDLQLARQFLIQSFHMWKF